MAEKKYYIRVPEALVEVSKEIYAEYYHVERHLKTLEEKDQRYDLLFYNEYDTDDGLGEELIVDCTSPCVEDIVIAKLMHRKLRHCLSMLPLEDQKLIHALFYEQVSEEELGKRIGISQSTVSRWKSRTIQKLQILINR